MDPLSRFGAGVFIAWLLASTLIPWSQAKVTLDGSLGPSHALSGPDYAITADLGRQVGRNLFHSFGLFNVNTGERATFSGPESIANILSRVTGGQASSIDGLLHSTIPQANLFLLNPSGVLFGPNAQLDVQGSFHVSTADFIRLADGVRFTAVSSAEDALLSTAPPEAFGFLGENPGPIIVTGSTLEVKDKTLGLEGGDITLSGGRLAAPSGHINLVSVNSPGEVSSRAIPEVEGFARLGKIHITDPPEGGVPSVDPERVFPSVEASGGGGIFIRSGEFILADTRVVSVTDDTAEKSGNLTVQTHVMSLAGLGAGLFLDNRGSGVGGHLEVTADSLHMSGGAQIGADTFGSGKGGSLNVKAHSMLLEGGRRFSPTRSFPTGLFARARGGSTGDAGNITVDVGRLTMRDGAAISASTSGDGRGGDLRITADTILLEGVREEVTAGKRTVQRTVVAAQASRGSKGDAGNLTVNVESLTMRDGAVIDASTFGDGRGGNLRVTADTMLLERDKRGFGPRLLADVFADVFGMSLGSPGLFARATKDSTGDAGNITVKVGRLQLKDGAIISVETAQSNAGDITLEVGSLLHLRDSRITTSVAGGEGSGGNITIDPTFVILDNSQIIAKAVRGQGGNIRITTDFLLKSPDSVIDASSQLGISGTVEIDAPDTDISGGISVLPAAFFDASTLLSERCAARTRGPLSSFVVVGRGGLPAAPGDGWSSSYLDVQAAAQSSLEGAGDSADVLEYDLLAPMPRCPPGVGK